MLKQVISQEAGWTRVAFGEVVRLSRARSKDPKSEGYQRVVGLEHIDPGDMRIRRWANIADGTSFTSVFQPGQVLFGKRRAYQRKVAVAEFGGVCSGDIFVLEPSSQAVMPELLPFICQTDAFFEHAIGTSAGSLSPRTNWKSLASFEFSLPPIQEQARLVDVLKAVRAVSESHFRMRSALRTLLSSLVDSTAQRGQKSGQAIPLDQLVPADRPICYGILMPGTGHEGGVPVIKVRDYPGGEIIERNLLQTSPELDEEYRRSRLEAGDLIISIRGTIGRLAVVPSSLDQANITQDTARISLKRELSSNFVRAMLESFYVQRQIAAYTTGLAVKGINIGELRRIVVPMVKRTEQDELVREIDDIRRKQRTLENRIEHITSFKKILLNKIGASHR